MPLAHETLDGASRIFVEPVGGVQVGQTALRAAVSSRFVLSARLRLRIESTVLRGRIRFGLDTKLRACFRSASAGSSGIISEARRSGAASPLSAVPADRAVHGHDRAPMI